PPAGKIEGRPGDGAARRSHALLGGVEVVRPDDRQRRLHPAHRLVDAAIDARFRQPVIIGPVADDAPAEGGAEKGAAPGPVGGGKLDIVDPVRHAALLLFTFCSITGQATHGKRAPWRRAQKRGRRDGRPPGFGAGPRQAAREASFLPAGCSTMPLSSASTTTRSPSLTVPDRIASASPSCTSRWMTRFSGRAP